MTNLFTFKPQKEAANGVFDDLTGRLIVLIKRGVQATELKGFYTCSCGKKTKKEMSTFTQDGQDLEITSLMLHQVIYHRDELPAEVLELITTLSEQFNVKGTVNKDAIVETKARKGKKAVKEEVFGELAEF